jgi:hypothetical protein
MTRYRNQRYLDEINDEGTDMEHVLQDEEDLQPAATPKEQTWEKRYGDLRRKHQSDTQKLEQRLKSLEAQLTTATSQRMELPTTVEEVKAWERNYPDVAKIIKTLIHVETQDKQDQILKVREDFETEKLERDKLRAYNELLKIHPDFEQINEDNEFHEWVQSQHRTVAESLYENDLDFEWAASSIEKYKLWMAAKNKKAAPAPTRDAQRRQDATAVRTPRAQEPQSFDNNVWSESRVAALPRTGKGSFDYYEAEIDAAIRSGKFVYDLQPGAY